MLSKQILECIAQLVEHRTFNPKVLGSSPNVLKNMLLQIYVLIFINTFLFFTGILGITMNRKNLMITLISLELVLLSINLNFVSFSVYLDDSVGSVFIFFVLTVAAAESAIGLALLTIYYRIKSNINLEPVKEETDDKKERK